MELKHNIAALLSNSNHPPAQQTPAAQPQGEHEADTVVQYATSSLSLKQDISLIKTICLLYFLERTSTV